MNLFKPKPKPAPLTLKERVTEFWRWFEKNADRFYATIENKKCGNLEQETSEAIDKWLGGMAWVYGPGPNKVGHSLTVTGEGILPKQFIAEYWANQAPKLMGWTFHASRQRKEKVGDFVLELAAEEKFRPIEFWVTPSENPETERFDLTVWHPNMARLPDGPLFVALYLVLDELLGEFGTQNWIGEIKFSDGLLQKSIPVLELRDVIANAEGMQGRKKPHPTSCYCTYRFATGEPWLRGDTLTGGTRFYNLIADYLENKGSVEHPTPDMGVDYVFVAIPADYFIAGNEVAMRGELEDAIVMEFEADAMGISLGGAFGSKFSYLDFVIYDGERSLKAMSDVLRRCNVPDETRIHFFTSDRAEDVIVI